MNPTVLAALQISLVSLGLVLGALVAVWGLLAALVRLTADKPAAPTAPRPAPNKQRVAAAAVAAALALRAQATPPEPERPIPAAASPWQTMLRAQWHRQRERRR